MSRYENDFEVYPWPGRCREMHICPDPTCGADKMQPLSWDSTDERGKWWVSLYCGECETFYDGYFDESQAEAFDEVLDDNHAAMKRALKETTHENMEDYSNLFSRALEAGQIFPSDF